MIEHRWYVGIGFDKNGAVLTDIEAKIEDGCKAVLLYFDGVTVTRGFGAWRDESGKVVREEQVTFSTALTERSEPAVKVAMMLKAIFSQSAVLHTSSVVTGTFH